MSAGQRGSGAGVYRHGVTNRWLGWAQDAERCRMPRASLAARSRASLALTSPRRAAWMFGARAPMTWRATGDDSPGLAVFKASAMARESGSVPNAAASVRVGRFPAAALRAFWDSAELK